MKRVQIDEKRETDYQFSQHLFSNYAGFNNERGSFDSHIKKYTKNIDNLLEKLRQLRKLYFKIIY